MTSRVGFGQGEDPAANDFSDIWGEKSKKADQWAAAWKAPGSASNSFLQIC